MLQFEECLKRELAVAEKDKAAFIKEFSESDYNAIEAGWKVKASQSMLLCSCAAFQMHTCCLCLFVKLSAM